MKKLFIILSAFVFTATFYYTAAMGATSRASDYVSANTYNNLYPYMNNTMRTNLNPGVNPSQSNAQINVLTRTTPTNGTSTRRVVARSARNTSGTTSARSATTSSAPRASTRSVSARRATNTGTSSARAATPARNNTQNTTRRVVARSATGTTSAMQSAMRTTRGDGNVSTVRQSTSTATYTTETDPMSSARCMADYTECMDNYCERADSEYNRCYCSSKLAQIDAMYQPEIDRLIKEILTVQNENYWTDAEMNEYWMETIGRYTGGNSWENLENALNIDWAGTESTVRGQQAFAMGHQYCVQHLQGCSYMQTNMRDAYRSEITRDCAAYETSLQQLKNAAESIVEAYK